MIGTVHFALLDQRILSVFLLCLSLSVENHVDDLGWWGWVGSMFPSNCSLHWECKIFWWRNEDYTKCQPLKQGFWGGMISLSLRLVIIFNFTVFQELHRYDLLLLITLYRWSFCRTSSGMISFSNYISFTTGHTYQWKMYLREGIPPLLQKEKVISHLLFKFVLWIASCSIFVHDSFDIWDACSELFIIY